MNPSISVIVPCYNQAQYLDECLQSVLDQTYQNWECIIVNDGSQDNTEEVAQKWIKKDSRFKYLFQENRGVSAARNFGIENAVGEWILPLDADDYIANDYLQLASQNFDVSEVKVIYCNARKFGVGEQDFILKDFSLYNLAVVNVLFSTAFFRRCDCLNINGFDESMHIGYEDWEFWIRLLKDGGEVVKLDIFGFFYRIKKESRNTRVMRDSLIVVRYIEKKHLDFFHEHLGSINQLFHANQRNEKVIDIIIKKRKVSRLVNKGYSFFENLFSKHN